MQTYALVIGGVFQEVRQLPDQPVNIPHKDVVWLPYETETIANNKTNHTVKTAEIIIEKSRVLKRSTISDLSVEDRRMMMECSPYQARMALLGAGLLDTVQQTIDALPVNDPARIAWEYATVIRRDSAFITAIGSTLELSPEQIDGLFEAAQRVE